MKKELRSATVGMLKIIGLLLLMLDTHLLWLFITLKVAAVVSLGLAVHLWLMWDKRGLLPDYWNERR